MIKHISSKVDGDYFWIKMGKFFASKEVRREFNNYPLNDSIEHSWFVFLNDVEEVISFIGLSSEKFKNKEVWITEMYTIAEYRNNGLSKLLFKEAMKYIQTTLIPVDVQVVKVCAQPSAYTHSIFKKDGFKVDNMRGAYTYYSKKLN